MAIIILYISIIFVLCLMICALFSSSYKYPLLALILIRPVIDATWQYNYGDFNLIYVLNASFIAIFFYRLFFKKEGLYPFKYSGFFTAYIMIIAFVSLHVLVKMGYISALEFFFKSFFMPLSFYLFYHHFGDSNNGKLLSATLIISGLFPLGMVIIQIATGKIGRFRWSRGLGRAAGLYHDNVSTRTYLVLTLIGILLYWHYFLRKRDKLKRIILIILSSMLIIGLYYQFSKAIIVTAIVWIFSYSLYRKKVHIMAFAFGFLMFLNIISDNKIFADMRSIFGKEVDLIMGRTEDTNILAGRILMWERIMKSWQEFPIIDKLLGAGIARRGFHNDYIRMLFSGGLLLLGISILMMLLFFFKININYVRDRSFIHLVAMMSLAYYLVESIGTEPGLYPHFQTIIWGIIGLSMNSRFRWGVPQTSQ